jgi:hypothetical protein
MGKGKLNQASPAGGGSVDPQQVGEVAAVEAIARLRADVARIVTWSQQILKAHGQLDKAKGIEVDWLGSGLSQR